jgi:hypothetical protein
LRQVQGNREVRPIGRVSGKCVLLIVAGILALSACSNRPEIKSVQKFYREGVPHTDRFGRHRLDYDKKASFFPLALYHALAGNQHGRQFELKEIAAAGFNSVHPWEGQSALQFAEQAGAAGLQIILHDPKDKELPALTKNLSLLAWYLDEEPSFLYPSSEIEKRLNRHERRRKMIRLHDLERPIIVIDGPATSKNLDQWRRWNVIGDVSSHFNYPVTVEKFRDYGAVERVAETTTMARRLVDGKKPLWMVLQAFGGERRGWRMPEPETLRAMAYAAIVHGATGLIYFAFDSFVTRDDGVLGIAPAASRDYGVTRDYNTDGNPPLTVSDADVARSKRLFAKTSELNQELGRLRAAILSATSEIEYSVSQQGEYDRGDAVRTLLKPYGNAHLLIAINVDIRQSAVRLRFKRPVASVEALFATSPPVAVSGDEISDRFMPEEVKIYRIVFSE